MYTSENLKIWKECLIPDIILKAIEQFFQSFLQNTILNLKSMSEEKEDFLLHKNIAIIFLFYIFVTYQLYPLSFSECRRMVQDDTGHFIAQAELAAP